MDSPKPLADSTESTLACYVVEPTAAHSHTVILLHGLGSNGPKFGKEFLETGITSAGLTLPQLLPRARFIFPTARRRRSTAFNRALITKWFDIARIEDPEYRKEVQLKGLEKSTAQVRAIIEEEALRVGPKNILLGGISNGGAMSMSILLAMEYPLGGYVGMSTYLPWNADVIAAAYDNADNDQIDEDDPFTRESETDDSGTWSDPVVKAMAFERDLVGLPPIQNPTRENTAVSTPVFMGHGQADEKKPYMAGQKASEALRSIGFEVTWELYPSLGHWYKIPEEIDDIVEFLRRSMGWELASAV